MPSAGLGSPHEPFAVHKVSHDKHPAVDAAQTGATTPMPLTTIPKRASLLEILDQPVQPAEGTPDGGETSAPIAFEPVVRESIRHLDEALSPNLLPANIELLA